MATSINYSLCPLILALCLTIYPLAIIGNIEAEALIALKKSLIDPNNFLSSWEEDIVNPCTFFHVTCNGDGHITRLELYKANLSGSLVPNLGILEYLDHLEIYENNIQGTIPMEFGNLKSLISLDLYSNNLTGTIPPSLGNLKSLKYLRLNDNHLTGTIPQEVINLNLQVLNVTNNDISE